MRAERKRLLAPAVYAGIERETAHAAEASAALDCARGLVARVAELDLQGEEIVWFLAQALLTTTLYERRENARREALATSAALAGAKALVSGTLQTQIDFQDRRAEQLRGALDINYCNSRTTR